MMQVKVIVSIIIVNYKVKERLLDCIDSVCSSKLNISNEIIVVDNEGDKSLETDLKKIKNVKYIKSFRNLGFGGGNNLGAKNANGKYLFFLNPDTLVVDNAVEKLYEFIKSNKNIGAVSPLLVDKNLNSFNTQSRKELTPLNTIFSFSFLRKLFPGKNIYNDPFFKKWNKKFPIEVDVVPGAAFMISKIFFEKLNGFDEKFFLYFEENDLSKRIKNLGLKLFITPNAKVIHEVGQSTKKIPNRDSIFKKSRFLYLKKHFGILNAIFVELVLQIDKYSIALLIILFVSIYLRTINLAISMPFIGDQGWFYLSARDMLIDGKIPLVGITSSHIWLHQGPLWTYMLSVALFLGRYNPLSGGYLTAIFGLGSTYLMYKLGSKMFSQKVGLIAASLYSVSPLIVFFERMPFDPSVIPFFTILYFYLIFKWVTGSVKAFPLILFLIVILYNLELATFTLVFPFLGILIYGFIKRKEFVVKLLNFRLFFLSLFFLITPMIPILIYDFYNGFNQTVIFLGWVIYKPFSFLIKHSSNNLISSVEIVINFILISVQKIVFLPNLLISILVFLSSFVYLTYLVLKSKKNKIQNAKFLLLILLIVIFIGILLNKTPSDAYLPIIFPFIIFTVSIFFDYVLTISKIKYIFAFSLLVFLGFNFYFAYQNTLKPDYRERINAVDKIISFTKNNKYNLIGKGEGSWFTSFTMNYEYLLWWKGYPPSKKYENLKIIIEEKNSRIFVSKL